MMKSAFNRERGGIVYGKTCLCVHMAAAATSLKSGILF